MWKIFLIVMIEVIKYIIKDTNEFVRRHGEEV